MLRKPLALIQTVKWLLVLCTLGCGGGLQLTAIQSAHKKPSNVAVYFSVKTGSGEPVVGLQATDFRILEDGLLVSTDESQQTIVGQEVAAEHYTLLLVDMSGSVTRSDQVPLIIQAANEFIAALEGYQKVAVYAFDGSEQLHRIHPFAPGAASGVARLAQFQTRDPSTNLHGAVVKGADVLKEALEQSRAPLRFGTMVVFTDGTDRAARVSVSQMSDRLNETDFDVFAIGVGNEIDEDTLANIGSNGYVLVRDANAMTQAFQAIGAKIRSYTQSFYLLSYCSPARAGTHTVTVEVTHQKETGSLSYEFDATGFGPGCNPNAPPPFDTRRIAHPEGERGERPKGTRIEVNLEVRAEASANTNASTPPPQ